MSRPSDQKKAASASTTIASSSSERFRDGSFGGSRFSPAGRSAPKSARDWQRSQPERCRASSGGAAPGALSRRGFKRTLLKLGDTLIVDGYRAKNGANLMDARRVTLPDGQVLSGASAGDGGPQ